MFMKSGLLIDMSIIIASSNDAATRSSHYALINSSSDAISFLLIAVPDLHSRTFSRFDFFDNFDFSSRQGVLSLCRHMKDNVREKNGLSSQIFII